MPTFENVAVDSILGLPANQGKTVKQSGYSPVLFWFKQALETWKGYATSPGGTQASGNFAGLVSSPDATKTYRPTMGGSIIQYATGGDVEFYYDTTTSKFKCGRPGDR
jgi:hypothetical protein